MFDKIERIEICAALIVLVRRHQTAHSGIEFSSFNSLKGSVVDTATMLKQTDIPVSVSTIVDFVTMGGK